MTSTSSGRRRVDAYDERSLQTKALDCWQRQRQAWEKMSANLKSRSSKRPPKTLNFDLASYQTREKQEDLGLIYAAVPQSVFSNYYTWESMLRCTSDNDAMRYVQIGKGYYPYALFGEVRDATVLKSNHPIYTRIIGEKYVKEPDDLHTSRARARDNVRRSLHIGPYLDKNEPDRLAAEQDGEVIVNPTDRLSHTDYYEQRLRLFAPFIQRRFSHFLLPRQALGVQGRPAPVEYGGDANKEDPDPVQYYPPPPQQLTLPSSAPPGDARSVSHQVLGTVPTPRSGDGVSSTKAADDISSVGGLTGDAEEDAQPFDSGRAGPSLVLSTKRLLFYAHPGELVHGRVLVQNKSHVTVYYTWMPLDLLAGYHTGAEGDDAPSEAYSDPRETLQELGNKLHALAHHSRASQNFFRFSRHVNGVILPEEEDIFPFSLRAPYPGRFKASYELLTIPPTPTRIIVELAAVVKVSAAPAQTLAKPVEDALNAKVTRNMRHQVQHLVRTQTPYDEADMYRAIEVIHEAKRNVNAAEKTKRALEKETWKAANMYTFDDIPYNAAVYDSLLNLRDQLKAAMITVGSPLRHDIWNSSLNELVGDICTLRDSPSRNVYYDAMMVLLRAARVAETENERLDVLLQKAAEAAAVQLEERRLNLFSSEAELLQLPKEPVAASTAAAGPHKRSQSMIRKPRDRHSRNDSVNPVPIPGTFRGHLRGTTLTREEEDALLVERESMINAFREGVLAEHPALVASLLSNYRAAVESACYLPLSQIVAATRAAAIVTIQKSGRIDVDCSSEVSLKAAGGKKK